MNKLILGLVMMAMLVAFSAPALASVGACPIDSENRFEVVVPNGSYTIQWSTSGPPTDFNVPNEQLYWVGIYSSAWSPGFPITATWNGHQLPDSDLSSSNLRQTGCGTTGFWFDDVTSITTPGAINTFTASNGYHGTSLPVIYTDPDNPHDLRSWFYQSYDDVGYNQGWVPYSFHNVTMGDATSWTLMFAVTCADNGQLKFNGNTLPDSGFCAATKWTHVAIHDVSGMVQPGVNTVEFDAVDDDYTHPYWMWLVGYTPQQKADITIPPDGIVIDPVTPRPGNNFMVNATILNQGNATAGQFSVSLYANDVLKGTVPVTGLVKDDNTTVSFTVNLQEGCYKLKVVADVYGEVDESDEYNNESTKDCQIGYVIVVESDIDFATLAADPGMPANSVTYDSGTDTYYIQDLTITNCAGDGIFIEGTTKNFVIKNCTIENCAPDASGVFLNDVTKGAITECTLQNNEAYGIELGLVPLDSEDPKFINITCNTIYQNGMSATKNGIDLIGTDCTVAYNHVIDNGEYGIYVYGNDNKIHNNTIEDNDNYGIKLYSSSGNYIYRNDLSNNNGVGVQGYDDTTTNIWRTPTPVNYCYSGATYTNYTGNYWNGYTGSDPDSDGIGTDAYTLDGGAGATDSYPAMVPWWRCGDVNRDGVVNYLDANAAFNGNICSSRWAADVDCNCAVNYQDANAIFNGDLNCCPVCCTCGECYCGR